LVQVTTSVPGLPAVSAVDRLVTTGSYAPKTTSVVVILHFWVTLAVTFTVAVAVAAQLGLASAEQTRVTATALIAAALRSDELFMTC
jgi:hypothetical protein